MHETVRMMTLGLFLIGSGGAGLAQDASDPDWPCVQRKVEHLSLTVMWPLPVPEDSEALPADLDDVAGRLALRRVSDEEAQALVAQVAAENPALGAEGFGLIFAAAFERIDRQRTEIVEGIGRYARNQARLAAEIEELRVEMAGLEAAEAPDLDRMDAIETEIDWRIRVFEDRNRALTYVCESPVLLEQRAYAVAQMLLAAAG